jgi:hypothetical protein
LSAGAVSRGEGRAEQVVEADGEVGELLGVACAGGGPRADVKALARLQSVRGRTPRGRACATRRGRGPAAGARRRRARRPAAAGSRPRRPQGRLLEAADAPATRPSGSRTGRRRRATGPPGSGPRRGAASCGPQRLPTRRRVFADHHTAPAAKPIGKLLSRLLRTPTARRTPGASSDLQVDGGEEAGVVPAAGQRTRGPGEAGGAQGFQDGVQHAAGGRRGTRCAAGRRGGDGGQLVSADERAAVGDEGGLTRRESPLEAVV